MSTPNSPEKESDRDRLIARPEETPLPATLDPGGPRARGYPADPKPGPEDSPGIPAGGGSNPDDLARTA
jgi:hypothetical protein